MYLAWVFPIGWIPWPSFLPMIGRAFALGKYPIHCMAVEAGGGRQTVMNQH